MKIGIIAAMEEESVLLRSQIKNCETIELYGFQFHKGKIGSIDIILLRSGIGKVASAISTTLLIDHFQPDQIINIGSAGALAASLNVGDIVISDCAHYYDVDVTGFGYELGQMAQLPARFMADPFLKNLAEITVKEQNQAYLVGAIASGDSFVNSRNKINEIKSSFEQAIAVEMEAASIAQVCYQLKVPFLIVRAISDRSDGESAIDFEKFLPISAAKSTQIVLCLLEKIIQ